MFCNQMQSFSRERAQKHWHNFFLPIFPLHVPCPLGSIEKRFMKVSKWWWVSQFLQPKSELWINEVEVNLHTFKHLYSPKLHRCTLCMILCILICQTLTCGVSESALQVSSWPLFSMPRALPREQPSKWLAQLYRSFETRRLWMAGLASTYFASLITC